MKYKLTISLAGIFMSSVLFASAVFSDETAGQRETPLFTNKDIEKYKEPEDSIKTDKKDIKDYQKEKEGRLEKIKEEREKEYWCKKATPYRRKIERTREDIHELENQALEAKGQAYPKKRDKAISRRLQNSRNKLKEAERDLDELENEAYRKGVPQGWLRCQFE